MYATAKRAFLIYGKVPHMTDIITYTYSYTVVFTTVPRITLSLRFVCFPAPNLGKIPRRTKEKVGAGPISENCRVVDRNHKKSRP